MSEPAGQDQTRQDRDWQDRDWGGSGQGDRDYWAAEDRDPGAAEAAAPDEAYAAIDAGDWLDDAPPGLWDERAGWTGDGEAFAAGFLHHDADGRYGTGFASGGELDVLAPGPALAGFVAAAAGPAGGGHAALGESELIGVLCGWQRMGAWAAAGQAAAALVLTGRAASVLAQDAAGLARLPHVHAALAGGASLASQMAVLETATCRHRRHEDRYQPSAPLAHLIRTRQPACCFPAAPGPLRPRPHHRLAARRPHLRMQPRTRETVNMY